MLGHPGLCFGAGYLCLLWGISEQSVDAFIGDYVILFTSQFINNWLLQIIHFYQNSFTWNLFYDFGS